MVMQRRTFCALGAGALLAPVASAQPEAPKDERAFVEHMLAMRRRLQALDAGAANPELRRESLVDVQHLQAELVAAKGKLDEVDLAEQAIEEHGDADAARREFRLLLADTLAESVKLEKAILLGDETAATTSLRKLGKHQETGHAFFQPARPS